LLRKRRIIIHSSKIQIRCNGTPENRKNDNNSQSLPEATYDDYTFCPNDDTSCHNYTWYDAIFPYWMGGMIWTGTYILNHQMVSVTTDPIFVSDLLPGHELSATIQTPEARSEDDNVGPRTSIALDSGSSIHIFKDAFLLMDIHSDDNQSIGVRTTDSRFRVNDIGRLCDDLSATTFIQKE
jgi:hypothetical protein